MTKEYAMQRLEELEKEKANLIKTIENNDTWPKTIEGMLEISKYWGFFTVLKGKESRYFLFEGKGGIDPCILSTCGVFTTEVKETIEREGMIIYEDSGFKSFESQKALRSITL